MATNRFENSRISEGTLHAGAPNRNAPNESNAISRDDVRDGFAERDAATTERDASNMIAEGGLIELREHPHVPLAPGAFMFLTVFSLNRIGDRARALWDPREAKV